MTRRFQCLAGYALDAGADGVLFTCSAFGPAIEACREKLQFSMTDAARLSAQASGRPVLTTPDSAVRRLRSLSENNGKQSA